MSTVLDWMRGCVGVRIDIMKWCRVCVFQLLSIEQMIIQNLFTG